ncbi:MAG: hypothetical protein Q9169_006938 [Polycauliona sp. 2 TL-2023]
MDVPTLSTIGVIQTEDKSREENKPLPPDAPDLDAMAQVLVKRLRVDLACEVPTSSISESIYSTAWVSMIPSPSKTIGYWLFPQAFDSILQRQLDSGGWSSLEASAGDRSWDVDRILNTMAALLALSVRRFSKAEVPMDIGERIARADTALKTMLQSWDVTSSDSVAFEILVPSHLDMLEKYDLRYDFSARGHLMKLHERKLQQFKPESLYGKKPSTLLHSLEGLVGKIDFDRMTHHKVNGSMLYSPSSTAAYLMNIKTWDTEAEAYLRRSVRYKGVPDLYPTNLFEISWALKILLDDFPRHILMGHELNQIMDFLENVLETQHGLVGWSVQQPLFKADYTMLAPGTIDDADDTSSIIYILNDLGRDVAPQTMLDRFEGPDRFRSYAVETTPSLTVNANVLKCLLHVANPAQYTSQIVKATTYIINLWWQGQIADKWTLTPQYTLMLLSQSLTMLLHRWEQDLLPAFPEALITQKIIPVVFGTAMEVLQSQHSDGSWGFHSRESTAYAILALVATAPLNLCQCLTRQTHIAISSGRAFLLQHVQDWKKPDLVWTNKVVYGLGVVSEAYTLAAMRIDAANHEFGKRIEEACKFATPSLQKIERLSYLPFFADTPRWLVDASIVESYLNFPTYDRARESIMACQVEHQLQFHVVPFAVNASSRFEKASMAPDIMTDFMVLCALIYDADHYFENELSVLETTELEEVQGLVHAILEDRLTDTWSNAAAEKTSKQQQYPALYRLQKLDEIKSNLERWMSWVIDRADIQSASQYDGANFQREVKTYFLSNLTSLHESRSLASSRQATHRPPCTIQQSYHEWVHSTSAAHTGGLLCFAFIACSLSARMDGQECFPTAEAKFWAADMSVRCAAQTRMENDVGSVRRDRSEHNLNSVDFPEFNNTTATVQGDEEAELRTKLHSLTILGEYERDCAKVALGKLSEAGVSEKVVKALKAFSNTVDLFGQMYATMDPSPALERCA